MPWLTPDEKPGNVCYRVFLPNSDQLRAAFLGAFLELCQDYNWQQEGTATPDEIADLFDAAYIKSAKLERCVMIGQIIWTAVSNPPDNALACDGAEYNVVDYAELHAAIGDVFGGDGGTKFNVPDLVNRAPVGAGDSYALGDSGGAADVTLTSTQLAAHFHSIGNMTLIAVSPGSGKLAIGYNAGSNYFVNPIAGSDPHENMPPFLALNPFIIFR